LYLAAEILRPGICHGFHEKAKKDDGQWIPEGPEVEVRPEGVDGSAVGAATALYPERVFEGLEITKDEAMPPEADAPAGRAAGGLLPRVFSAEIVKLLYIDLKV
jgi:hypothetical protein